MPCVVDLMLYVVCCCKSCAVCRVVSLVLYAMCSRSRVVCRVLNVLCWTSCVVSLVLYVVWRMQYSMSRVVHDTVPLRMAVSIVPCFLSNGLLTSRGFTLVNMNFTTFLHFGVFYNHTSTKIQRRQHYKHKILT